MAGGNRWFRWFPTCNLFKIPIACKKKYMQMKPVNRIVHFGHGIFCVKINKCIWSSDFTVLICYDMVDMIKINVLMWSIYVHLMLILTMVEQFNACDPNVHSYNTPYMQVEQKTEAKQVKHSNSRMNWLQHMAICNCFWYFLFDKWLKTTFPAFLGRPGFIVSKKISMLLTAFSLVLSLKFVDIYLW